MGHSNSIPEDSSNFHHQQWSIVFQPCSMQKQNVRSSQKQSHRNNWQSYPLKSENRNQSKLRIQFQENYQVGQFLPEFGNYKLIKNRKSNTILQLHSLVFSDQKDYLQYLQKHFWRQRQDNFVKTYFLVNQHVRLCCSYNQEIIAQIFIQHMQVRLSDITDIPYPQNLYVIQACLKGFHKLFQQVGYFKITEDLIGINRQGKIKVWLNANLAINAPNYEQASLFPDEIPQCKMVKQIIDMVQRETDQDTQPNKSFSKYLLEKKKNIHRLTFAQCKNQLEKFAKHMKIKIPTLFGSMLEIINDQINDSFIPSLKYKNSQCQQFSSKRSSNTQNFGLYKSLKSNNNNVKDKGAKSIRSSRISSSKGGFKIQKNPNQLQSIPQINFNKSSQRISNQSRRLNTFNPQFQSLNKKYIVKPTFKDNRLHVQSFTTAQNQYDRTNINYIVQKPKTTQLITMPSKYHIPYKSQNNQIKVIPDLEQRFGHFKPIVPYNFLEMQNKNSFFMNGNANTTINNNVHPYLDIKKKQSAPENAQNSIASSINKKSIISNKAAGTSKLANVNLKDGSINEFQDQVNKSNKIHLNSKKQQNSKSASSLNSGLAQVSNISNQNYLQKSIDTRRQNRKFDPKYFSQICTNQMSNSKRRKEGSPHRSVISVSKRNQKGQFEQFIRQSCEKDQKLENIIYSSVIAKPQIYNRPVNAYINCPSQPKRNFLQFSQMLPHEIQKMTDSDLHFLNNADQIERKYILQKTGSRDTFDYLGQQNYLSLPKKKPYGLSLVEKQKYRVFSQCTQKNMQGSQVNLDPQILKDLAKYGL